MNVCCAFSFFCVCVYFSPSLQSLAVQALAELEMDGEVTSLRSREFDGRENPQIPETLLTAFRQAVMALQCCVVTRVIVSGIRVHFY